MNNQNNSMSENTKELTDNQKAEATQQKSEKIKEIFKEIDIKLLEEYWEKEPNNSCIKKFFTGGKVLEVGKREVKDNEGKVVEVREVNDEMRSSIAIKFGGVFNNLLLECKELIGDKKDYGKKLSYKLFEVTDYDIEKALERKKQITIEAQKRKAEAEVERQLSLKEEKEKKIEKQKKEVIDGTEKLKRPKMPKIPFNFHYGPKPTLEQIEKIKKDYYEYIVEKGYNKGKCYFCESEEIKGAIVYRKDETVDAKLCQRCMDDERNLAEQKKWNVEGDARFHRVLYQIPSK